MKKGRRDEERRESLKKAGGRQQHACLRNVVEDIRWQACIILGKNQRVLTSQHVGRESAAAWAMIPEASRCAALPLKPLRHRGEDVSNRHYGYDIA